VNICSGKGRSLRSVLADLQAMTGHQPEICVASNLVRRAEVHRLVGSSDRLRAIIGSLGFSDFADTLRWMVEDAGA
jgi:hypothetical protein